MFTLRENMLFFTKWKRSFELEPVLTVQDTIKRRCPPIIGKYDNTDNPRCMVETAKVGKTEQVKAARRETEIGPIIARKGRLR
jgi:hypothetical protein